MNASPVILANTILSNGSMAVLAGNPDKQVVQLPNGQGGTFPETYYGFNDLQVVVVSQNNSPVALNQSAGNLSFASGDSPNNAVPGGNGQDQGDETTGGGNILALPNGDIAVVTWGDYNHNYDLQILDSSGGVVTAPFAIGSSLAGSNPIAGNPYAAIATNGSEFVVAWNTDDITGLEYQRFSLTGTALDSPVVVKSPSALNPTTAIDGNAANNNSNWGDSLAIDSQGNVILGFSAEDIYHSGYFNEYNSSDTKVVGTPSSPQVMGSSTILNQDQAPVFAPVSGGGFITAGYTISPGTQSGNLWSNYNSGGSWNSGTFTLNVQKISTSGSVSTIATVGGFSGGVQTRGAYGEATLSNGLVAFQEDAGQTGDQGANDWDTVNASTNALTRNAFSVAPGTDTGPATPYANDYFYIPYPVANVSGGGFATLSVNSTNGLVASGLVTTVASPSVTEALVSDTGSSSTDKITSNPALTGGGDANATVTLTEGSTTLGAATANGSGVWTYTPTGLADGAHTIVASETNSGGTGSSSVTFTLDTTPPAVTEALVSDTGSSATDKITSNDAITGGGDANATVTLTQGGTTLGTTTANAAGVWTYTPSGLADGAHTIVAKETDTAGNIGSSSLTFTVDTTPPAVTETLVSDTGSSATDKITSNDAITGGGDANATVTLTQGGTTLGTTTANAAGVWTYTPTGLADGAHTIVAKETDTAGNTGSSSLTFTVDTTPPAVTEALVSDTGSSATDKITSNDAITGGGDPNATVTLTQGGTTLGTTTANAAGVWTYTPTGLADGAHTVIAKETDTAGNTGSSSLTFTLDTTPPTTPGSLVLTSDSGVSNSDDLTNVALSSFAGTGETGATISLLDGTTVIGSGVVTNGTWSITATTALSEGVNAITATQTDVAGNTSVATTALDVTLDTTPPVVVEMLASDTGFSMSDRITSNDSLTGTAEANGTVTITDGATTIGTPIVNTNGSWSFAPVIGDGSYTLVASETDAAGNTGSSSLSFTLDTTPPAAPGSLVLTSDSGISNSDDITNVALSSFAGTGETGATVSLLDGTTVIGSGVVTNGTWSITATTSLSEGANAIAATQTDAAGNTSAASTALNVILDTVGPAFTERLVSDTGSSGSDNITSNANLTGIGDPYAVVTLAEGSTLLGTTTTNALGAWSFTPTGLSQGAHTVIATESVTDTAGNPGTASLTFTFDSTPPAAPGSLVLTSDSGISNSDDITKVAPSSFAGTGETGATVSLLDGTTVIGSGVVTNGTWSITAATALSEGANAITATQTDTAGNTSAASTALDVTLDTTPPAAPGSLVLTSDSGISNSDDLTNVALSSFAGTGETGATVSLLDGTTVIGSGVVTNGTWSITATTSLSEGANAITATQTDAAGNTSTASTALDVTLDTTPPAAPGSLALTSDSGISNSDDLTNIVLSSFAGTGETGATVSLLDGTTVIGSGVVTNGTWSITAATALSEGANAITATQTDTAGNTSAASAALDVSLDTTPPAAPGSLVLTSDSGISNSDDITNIALSSFAGTGETGAIVSLVDGTTVIGSGVVTNGTWSITATTGLSEGANAITATQTDAAGNTSAASGALNVILDTVGPAFTERLVSDTGSSGSDNITSNASLTGIGDPYAVVTLTEGSTLLGTTTTNALGAWSFTPTGLSQGAHTVIATESVTDTAGNPGTASLTFTFDSTPPAAPGSLVLTSDSGISNSDDITKVAPSSFAGTGETGATVSLLDGTTVIGSGVVTNGTWSITAATALSEGANAITATQTDAAGNTSTASTALDVTLDTTPPVAPGSLALTSDSGISNSDDITNIVLSSFAGTGETGATVSLLDGTTVIGSGVVTNGTWSITATTALSEGANAITATQTDAAGNTSTASTALDVTLDTTPPAAPGSLALTSDSGISNSDDITNIVLSSFAGTGETGATVSLLDGTTVIGSGVVTNGTWSITAATALSEGANAITATQTDTAGNTSAASAALDVTLDTTPPAAPGGLVLTSDSGISNSDDITNVALSSFAGTGETGATVSLLDGTTVIGSGVVTNGTWSITDTTSLSEGANAITATQTDAAGNTSATATVLNVTLDTTPPAAPGGLVLTSDSGVSNSDDITNVTLSSFAGTGETGATVSLLDGTTVIGSGVVTNGTWSITATTALSEGANAITATQTDAAGNTSAASTALSVTLDTTPPAAPGSLVLTSDSGISNSDDITKVARSRFAGTGETGATVSLLDGTTVIGSGVVTNGTWSITAATALSEGANAITATQTDAAGNTSAASTALSVTLDTTPPAAPGSLVLTSDSGISNSDDITNVALSRFAGTGENGATVSLLDGTTVIGSGVVTNGTWSITATTALSEGANAITATQTDAAGNTSAASTALNVTLDTTPPAAPGSLVLTSDSGISNSDDITKVARSRFAGTGETGATVSLLDGTTVIGSGVVTNGTWSITATTALSEGANAITTTQTDVAGNISAASTVLNVTLDTTPPAAPGGLVLTSDSGISNSDDITKVARSRFAGTGETGATVSLLDGTTVIGSGVVTNGNWSITATTALSEGANAITTTQTDVAGNISAASTVLNVTLDTNPPPAPSIPDLIAASDSGASHTDDVTNVTNPTFSGTAEAGSAVTLFDRTARIGSATAALDGSWMITVATLSAGTHNIAAQATDAAGNVSALSGPLPITIDPTTPTVTTVTALPSTAVLVFGDTASITLGLDETVTVSGGAPTLTLNNGGTASYVSGSGTNDLTFDYTVGPNQDTSDLTVAAAHLNGATVADQAGNVADLSGAAVNPPGTLVVDSAVGFDVSTGQPFALIGQPYTGPVAGLQEEYISISPHNLSITAPTPNWFIHAGAGDDAIAVTSGDNVLDGGTGSNFLVGGTGDDTFFTDARGATADIWSTIVNFHAGDAATLWGVTPADFTLTFTNGQGAPGYTGLTLHATAPGQPNISVTFVGFTTADLTTGRISETSGIDAASGAAYMNFHANS